MAIYTDGVHLMADTLAELHYFASQLGLKRCWFQAHKRHPHYDVLSQDKVQLALLRGAKKCLSKDMLRQVRRAHEICMCGDYRREHEGGEGRCLLCKWNPANPFEPCEKFRGL